ncbi:TIR domain-containing protein [Cupriavidus pauculus]|uniref:TIR domain-containing protein n=1 Tax=Cupriavidus pauculus TaxID=82633 RepID=UPI00124527D7|nr:TIR domain-containing protein [Cupriavidus pauculus]KAB0598451.1 TIR domain-containing protein [Cupriavidus pauculus]MCM3608351.1 TIR domain-containing protein [Cupriavidus pauculus]UAL00499.1 TIR domain-containing protein [Cupriavidus pauculus]
MSDHQIFLSYGSPDLQRVRAIYDRLREKGLNIWFDKEKLRPGQQWDFEIRKALRQSDIVLLVISGSSIDRRGYVQREIKIAISYLEEKLRTDVYAIPILLDDGISLHPPLSDIQHISASDPNFEENLLQSINIQLAEIGKEQSTEVSQDIVMSKERFQERWDGQPGFEIEYWLPRYSSKEYTQLREVSTLIESYFVERTQAFRRQKLEQDPASYHWSQPRFRRTNTYSGDIMQQRVVGRVLSITYLSSWYYAGAAHGNYSIETFNFFLDPLIKIENIKSIFKESDETFSSIQSLVRKALMTPRTSDDQNEQSFSPDEDWIIRGTESWSDFEAFSFSDNSLVIHFSPYHVACFAAGPQQAELPLDEIKSLFADSIVGFFDLPL